LFCRQTRKIDLKLQTEKALVSRAFFVTVVRIKRLWYSLVTPT
jgi:hypothetical protein